MIHCSECKHYREPKYYDDESWIAALPYYWDEEKWIAALSCAVGQKIFIDLACSKFEERGPNEASY